MCCYKVDLISQGLSDASIMSTVGQRMLLIHAVLYDPSSHGWIFPHLIKDLLKQQDAVTPSNQLVEWSAITLEHLIIAIKITISINILKLD